RRPGFRAIEAWLGGPVVSRAVRKLASGFVGREHALQQLDQALQLSARQPILCLVRGESGIGKSALLQHFVHTRAREAGGLALCGRCYERESVPYKALDGVMDELSQHLLAEQHTPQLSAADTRALLQVFPVLARVPALRRAAGAEPDTGALELRTQAVR